ncbi:MAG: hypothetical protein AB8D78_01550 [Akkermansiaceae bacterium]
MKGQTTREHCLAILTAMHGPGSMPYILNVAQPDLEGRTLAEMLQNEPEKLLGHLQPFSGKAEG